LDGGCCRSGKGDGQAIFVNAVAECADPLTVFYEGASAYCERVVADLDDAA